MPYALGVDIGTSTLTTATYRIDDRDDPVVTPIHLDPDGPSSTAVVIADDGRVIVGADADLESAARPERLLRGWSRRVGDTVPIVVGDAMIAPESIFAAVVRWAVMQATSHEGMPPAAVCVSHPAGWGEYRVSLLQRALQDAEIDVIVVDESVAVLEQHGAMLSLEEDAMGIYDLGADRMTFSLMSRYSDRGWTRSDAETVDGVGGTRLDDAVLAHVIASSTDAFSHFDTAADGSMADMRMLRSECVAAKGLLSSNDEVSVPVRLDGIEQAVHVEPLDLRAAVEHTVVSTARAVHEAYQRAGRTEADAAIILVGGSSGSPQLRARLAAELDARLIVDDDPQMTIAFGAARMAATRVDWTIADAEAPVAASGSASVRAAVTRVYATAVSALGSVVRKRVVMFKRPTPPSIPAQDADPSAATVELPRQSFTESTTEAEFDHLISPDRLRVPDDGEPANRGRGERTEVAR